MKSKLYAIGVLLLAASMQAYGSNDSLYLSPDEFRYADNQRYTMFGGTPRRVTEVQPIPTLALGAGYVGLGLALHFHQKNAWWPSGDSARFKFKEDLEYARGLDKAGHVYSSYITATFTGDVLMESGFDRRTATWIGGATGLAYTLYVEVMDGFAREWGFSPSDAIADVVGSSFYVAQEYVPYLQNFTPRWSYVPAAWVGDPTSNNRQKTIIDDYNSTTFWLACNVNNMLPTSAAEYWPDWMMLSLGYGIRNYDVVDASGRQVGATRRFLVGIDYDWVKIIPPSSVGVLNYLRQALIYVRLPGPTLEIGDDGVKVGVLYPFAIVVPI
jgi:hypothetical protein